MGVAETVDQLRCNTWLLARRTRRWGRAIQHDAGDMAERLTDWRRDRSGLLHRLSRTAPAVVTIAGLASLKERFGEPVRKGAKAAVGYVGLKNLLAEGEERLETGAARLRETAKSVLGYADLTKLSRRDLRKLQTKAAKAGLSVAGMKAAIGRAESRLKGRREGHAVLWGLGFVVAGLAAATYVATRVGQSRLKVVEPPADVQVKRYATAFGEIAYRVVGEGTPLILLHPLLPGASGHVWDDSLEALAKQFQVFVVDWLGFGLSDKPDISYTADRFAGMLGDFAQDVVKGPAVIVAAGHSGAIAARAVGQTPAIARQLVLVNPVGSLLGKVQRFLGGIASLPGLAAATYLAMVRRGMLERTLRDEFAADASHVSDSLIDSFYAHAHQPGASHAVRDLMAGRIDLDLPAEVGRASVPLAFVWGKHKGAMAIARADELHQIKPDASVTVFANSAWLPQIEDKEGFTQLLVNRFVAPAQGQGQKPRST